MGTAPRLAGAVGHLTGPRHLLNFPWLSSSLFRQNYSCSLVGDFPRS